MTYSNDKRKTRGQVAITREQKFSLTVIDDLVVRSVKKNSQRLAESGQLLASNLSLKVTTYHPPCQSFTSSLFSNSQSQRGKGLYSEQEIFYSSALSPDSTDSLYQTTSSLPPSELVYYYHHDHLGNIRAVTNKDKLVVERHDFYPFGEEITTQPQNTYQYLFTGKPRDSETGLDYFGARYYSYSLSRWMSPDVIKNFKVCIQNPQKWNLYIYVINNPIKFLYPEGNEEKISYFIVVDPSPPRITATSFAFDIIQDSIQGLMDSSFKVYAKYEFFTQTNATLRNFKKELLVSSMIGFIGHSVSENNVIIGLKFSDNTLKAGSPPLNSKAIVIFIGACGSAAESSKLPELFGIDKNTKDSAFVGFDKKVGLGYAASALREFSNLIQQGYSVKDAVQKTNEYLKELAKKSQDIEYVPLTFIGGAHVKVSQQ